MTGKSNFPFSVEDLQKKAVATQRGPLLWLFAPVWLLASVKSAVEKVKGPQVTFSGK